MAGVFRRFMRGLLRATQPRSLALVENMQDAERLADALSALPNFRVLRAVASDTGLDHLRAVGPNERVAAVIDTETTGLDPEREAMIEIAVQRFIFDRAGRITDVERPRAWMEDPKRPLPDLVATLTGITEQDLANRAFDDQAIIATIRGADILIAHNAAFDRPFIDRRFPELAGSAWACSLSQLDWQALGYEGRALGYLLMQSGRFFDGHRASNDTTALTTLLATPADDGRTILSHLLDECERNSVRVDAIGAPFEAKGVLKDRGYRWDVNRRVWWREVRDGALDSERGWLARDVYLGRGEPRLAEITPRTRFKREF